MEPKRKTEWSRVLAWLWLIVLACGVFAVISNGTETVLLGMNANDFIIGLMIGSIVMGVWGRLKLAEKKDCCC